MKSAVLFFAGIVVGALIIWFGFSKSYILLPSGTTLVEVNRFNGSAREVFYSQEEAERLHLEEGQRMVKIHEAWAKSNPPAETAVSPPEPFDADKKAPELPQEELALVKYTASVQSWQNNSRLQCFIYNGTTKTLVRGHVRIEGTHKETGLPLARNVEIPMSLKPSTDTFVGSEIDGGFIDSSKVEGLKVTLVKVQGK